jgi:hypothetical protein
MQTVRITPWPTNEKKDRKAASPSFGFNQMRSALVGQATYTYLQAHCWLFLARFLEKEVNVDFSLTRDGSSSFAYLLPNAVSD